MYNRERENCLLYGVVGCLLFRGCLSIEVNGQVENTEVRKPKCGNGSTETEVRK